jgi:hypothetical protein
LDTSKLVVAVWDETSTPVQILVDSVVRTDNNTVTINVTESPDLRFDGRIVISAYSNPDNTNILSVTSLPTSSIQTNRIYNLTVEDTTAKASTGFWVYYTYWDCLSQSSIYSYGNATGSVTITDVYGQIISATSTGDTTWTFPTAVAGKSFSLHLIDAGDHTQTITALWDSATPPTISGTCTFLFYCVDGTNWIGQLIAGAIA